ncbi:MogA/MoaB family molybdenum cofactor biosynthesis protein [Rubricoccus marinus]|uniref:Molybdenum cofactor biosynthesis protein B n=1 Tax=Rubricoccus marinus TaxID=716817 RepID=A0A259U0G6_9BACT|nr:MogA/MoaB family molybdenum cofactor biosynthesis protein [Rubricoccus marinus]OZC03489.1 molybdenum cofactor biosynthesis protein [Rubricoccus marinus]
MSVHEHRAAAPNSSISCAVVTVSDTRTKETDASGDLIKDRLREAGHLITFSRIVPDDAEEVRSVLLHLAGEVEVVITSGGTGIATRDRTVEVADRLIQKPLPGFGEIFRMLSFETIGAAAMLTRATAGLYGPEDGDADTLLFCCPGSPDAVTLAMDRLIVPELPHTVWEVVRQMRTTPEA